MSFLTEIKNFIRTEVFGIEEKSPKASVNAQNNNPVIECETDEPEDKFQKSGAEFDKTQNNSMSMKALEDSLRNIPAKNIDINKLIKSGIIQKITNLPPEAFTNLSAEKKNLVIKVLQYSVMKLDSMMEKGKINKAANPESLAAAYAKNLYEMFQDIKNPDIESFDKEAGDVVQNLGKDFDKCSQVEKKERLKKSRILANKELQADLEEIKNLPEEKRKAAAARIIRRHKFIMRKRFLDVTAQKNSETSANAIILLNSEDMEFGAKTIIETRCSKEEQTRVADYANYAFTKDLIKTYQEVGDSVPAPTLKGYTQTFMEYKSPEAATEYQNSYVQDRNLYEKAKQKQQNGEPLTPEEQTVLSVMNDEYYTYTAQGIGEGVLNNTNMTSEQKAQFITAWENDAKQYSDYNKVVSTVLEKVQTEPAYKDIKIQKAKLDKNQTEVKVQRVEKENSSSNRSDTGILSRPDSLRQNKTLDEQTSSEIKLTEVNKTEPRYLQKTEVKSNEIRKNAASNPIAIAKNIKEEGVEGAIKKYGSDAIEIILDYYGFKHLRSKLTTIIRSYDLKTLEDITKSCSDTSFVYICSVVNSDYVTKLRENRERTKGLCYVADKLVKNMEGEYASV